MSQLCIWPGTVVGEDEVTNFEKWFKEDFDVEVAYLTEFETLPGQGGPGGRNDVLFELIFPEDVQKFAVKRLSFGIRWWEDYLDNGNDEIVPQEILDKYPYGWDSQE